MSGVKKIIATSCILLFLLIPIQFAQAEGFNPMVVSSLSSKLSREGKISTTVGELYGLNVNLAIPQNTSYQSVSLTLPPEASVVDVDGNQVLKLSHPSHFTSYSYAALAEVQTLSRSVKSLPPKYAVSSNTLSFTKESEHVKISPDLERQARSITSGYKEEIDKVAALAIWVNNYMTYDISQAGANKGSLEVYKNPVGVCVEYTNLFMALSRSLGYPTRSVLGYVYSPSYGWQLHSWAEVYIGEWVGVDPTWLEVGYIDATHIPMYYSSDTSSELIEHAKAFSTDVRGEMRWEGKGTLGGSTGDISIISYNVSMLPYTIKVLPSNLTIGEDGAILITITSPDYRIFTARYLSCEGDPSVVEFGDNRTDALLHPGENNIVIPFRVSPLLRPDYRYFCPITVSHSFGSDMVSISVQNVAKPAKKFGAVLSRYHARQAKLHISALADENITIVKDRGTETVRIAPGTSKEIDVDLSDGFAKAILIYDRDYAQPLAVPVQAVSQSNAIYVFNGLSLTGSIPSDRNGSLQAAFSITGNASYTARVYIDGEQTYSETSSSPTYTINYPIVPTTGKHSISLVMDFGSEQYKYDGTYVVFNPEITVDKVSSDSREYAFRVNGPYQAYRIFIDGTEINPGARINLTAGTHELRVDWIDSAGYERTHSEELIAGGLINDGNAPVCMWALLLAAVPLAIVILFFINTRKSR